MTADTVHHRSCVIFITALATLAQSITVGCFHSAEVATGFLRELEDIQLNDVGLEATFECEVSKPNMRAEWFKGDKQIRVDADKYKTTSKNGKHSLTITDCQSEDVAKYTVKLNGLSSSAKLDVTGNCASNVLFKTSIHA
jgi:Immunoglobulin I-set domain